MLLTKSVLKTGGFIQPEAFVIIKRKDKPGINQANFNGIWIFPGSHFSNINVIPANRKKRRKAEMLTAPEDPTVWRISAREYPNRSAPNGTSDELKYLIRKNWDNTQQAINKIKNI